MTNGGLSADLVLEGGGVKGIGLAGAYSVLLDRGYRFHRVAGTSAGAIVGALVAAGITPDELEETMRTLDYGKFQDKDFLDHLPLVGRGVSLLFEKGIYEGDYLKEWLDDKLKGLGKRTWGDFRIEDPNSSLPEEKRYSLVVMASDVTRGRLVRFPWDYPRYGLDPDQELVADAVRCSMSIPFFYEPVKFKGRDPQGEELTSYMVDGGMLSNFPIDVFDRTDGKTPRWPTFGIKLSARPSDPEGFTREISGPLDLAFAMLSTMTGFYDRIHIDDPCVIRRTMFVDSTGVKATDFDLDEPTQERLFANGRSAAEEFLGKWNWDAYLKECRSN